MSEGDAGRRDALKRELAELRRQMEIANARFGPSDTISAAIDQAERHRDAVTSPVVEDLRRRWNRSATRLSTAG